MKRNLKFPRILMLILIIIIFSGCVRQSVLQNTDNAKFIAIPLGTKGGLIEADLSSYLLAPYGDPNFIVLDAGTLMTGLQQTAKLGSLQKINIHADSLLSPEGVMLRDHIKAYAISHAHLDHVAGLVINSPDDSSKPILGLPSTIDNIRYHLFNWKIWPNFGNEGDGFQLKKYRYIRLLPGEKFKIENTMMTIIPFELSHSGGYISTAFLVESGDKYMLYFGDCGPDVVEKSDKMQQVWTAVAPLVQEKKLHGMFLECSFSNDHPDEKLFGHLTPKWMMQELRTLSKLVDPNQPEIALTDLKVVVTHIKPSLKKDVDPSSKIMNELSRLNDLGIEFILPESGKIIYFD